MPSTYIVDPAVVGNVDFIVAREYRRHPTSRAKFVEGEREIVECLPLNVIVGELLARNDDGEEDEQADGVLVIQPVGKIVVASPRRSS